MEIESDTVTLEFARESIPETDEPSLWVYFVEDWGGRRPIREVTWAFEGGVSGEKGKEEECWVGVYAAKPTPTAADPSEELEVQFSGLIIE